jgi:hypothetical protein
MNVLRRDRRDLIRCTEHNILEYAILKQFEFSDEAGQNTLYQSECILQNLYLLVKKHISRLSSMPRDDVASEINVAYKVHEMTSLNHQVAMATFSSRSSTKSSCLSEHVKDVDNTLQPKPYD